VRASYQPVELQTRTLFNPGSNYSFFVTPLLIILLIHQVVALGSGMSFAKHGIDESSVRAASGSVRNWFGGLFGDAVQMQSRIAPYVIVGTFWVIISIIGTHPWLGIPRPASFITALVLGVLLAWNASLFGTLAGALIKDKIGVVQVLFFLSMPLLLLSGGSWPLGSMPWYMRALALCLPSTHAMTAYRALALEGASFLRVLPALSVLLLTGVVLSLASAAAARTHRIPSATAA
jgi:ABC-2 type transport system permease protein